MNPQFDEVLLTAYLDNEVTDQERASVEEQLQSSEASRNLLEELRSVRNLVAQLHLSQPARRFQQGPWNEPALPEVNDVSLSTVTPKVVVNETSWYRWMPLQRLASLAALIAIAVCASVFLMGPNTQSDRRISERGRTETASDAKVDPSRSLSKLSKTLDSNPPPAPASAIASLSPAVSNIGKAAESQPGVVGLADDSKQVLENFVKLDSSGLRGSNEFKKEIFFRYRANKTDQNPGIASAEKPSAGLIRESLGRNISLDFEKKRVEAEVGIETGGMLVEFQIPIENWEQGIQRLRKLGMVLPEKVPTVDYLEFTAIPIAGTNGDSFFDAPAVEMPIDRFVVDVMAAKEVVLSQWQFSGVAPHERESGSKSETPAKELAAKDKKENGPSSSIIRIRVRPIR